MKILLIALCFMTLSLNAQDVPLYEQVTSNVPVVGENKEVYLGDRMLIQREGEYRECIVPKRTIESNAMRQQWTLKSKQPLCKRDADSEFYHPNYIILPVCEDPSVQGNLGCDVFVRFINKNGSYELHICQEKMMGKGGNCYKKLRFKNLTKNDVEVNNEYFLYTENTFQQSIEYAGRDGDNLKFTYSEFTDGFARQAFTREFQVDYSKGDIAAYKGAIIKIHDATNVNIVYEVIRNFQQ